MAPKLKLDHHDPRKWPPAILDYYYQKWGDDAPTVRRCIEAGTWMSMSKEEIRKALIEGRADTRDIEQHELTALLRAALDADVGTPPQP